MVVVVAAAAAVAAAVTCLAVFALRVQKLSTRAFAESPGPCALYSIAPDPSCAMFLLRAGN